MEVRSQCSRPTRSGRGLILLIAILLVVGAGGYVWYRFSDVAGAGGLAERPMTVQVTKGPFDHIVLEQGEIESSSNIDVIVEVKSKGSSGTAILLVIDEGTSVKKGDKLVELDSSAMEDELKRQRITVSSAEAQVISSEATVRTNEIALQEYLKGTYQSERRAILSEIAVAEQELRNTELNLDSARRLAAKGMLKALQIEAEEFSVSNARNVLESATARLEVLDKLTKERNRVQLESEIEAAKAKLSSDQSVLAEEQSKMVEIQDQIQKCIIFSPADGIVVYNNQRSGRGGSEFIVEEGAVVRERQCIIKLPDPSKMQVKALINESRVVRIEPGMPSKIRVSAFPQDMTARVLRVNKYAEPGSWFSSSVKQYAAYLEIVDPPESIRTGMSAEVRIFVEQLTDAVQIPVHGVYEHKEHHFCLIPKGLGWETRPIKLGAANEKMVTITEGLSEIDQVVLNPREFLDLMNLPKIDDVKGRDELIKLTADKSLSSANGGTPTEANGSVTDNVPAVGADAGPDRQRGKRDDGDARGGKNGQREPGKEDSAGSAPAPRKSTGSTDTRSVAQ